MSTTVKTPSFAGSATVKRNGRQARIAKLVVASAEPKDDAKSTSSNRKTFRNARRAIAYGLAASLVAPKFLYQVIYDGYVVQGNITERLMAIHLDTTSSCMDVCSVESIVSLLTCIYNRLIDCMAMAILGMRQAQANQLNFEPTFNVALPTPPEGYGVATFAGGCFWCMEGPFDKLDGVVATTSGYTGGKEKQPTYRQVSRHHSPYVYEMKAACSHCEQM